MTVTVRNVCLIVPGLSSLKLPQGAEPNWHLVVQLPVRSCGVLLLKAPEQSNQLTLTALDQLM